jgi:23S rRNA (pseudouridine1915-N3)-methyltransferase
MQITLLCFGRPKTPGITESIEDYAKRLPKYGRFEAIELKASSPPDRNKDTQTLKIWLNKHPGTRGLVWILDETGKSKTTLEWAEDFRSFENDGLQHLVITIGGANGLLTSDIQEWPVVQKISLGPQTLSHEIARLVVTEQIYRAYSVVRGEPYHRT